MPWYTQGITGNIYLRQKEGILMIQFTDDCKIGVERIDNEHAHLFSLLNDAYELLQNTEEDYSAKVQALLLELQAYAATHFKHEEDYMIEIRDPELISQRIQHKHFKDKLAEYDFSSIDVSTQRETLLELIDFITKWLYKHILGSDIQIGQFEPMEEWMTQENVFAFTDEYRTGIEMVDLEHEQLFHIIDKANALVESYNPEFGYDNVMELLNELKEYTEMHFHDEEEYMESIHYDGLAAQQNAHNAFIEKLGSIDQLQLDEDPEKYLHDLIDFLTKWLIQHILRMDKQIPLK